MDTAESRMRMLQNSRMGKEWKNETKMISSISGGKMRFMLALVLFLSFFVLEKRNLTFLGIAGETIYETVCKNAKGFDFVLDFPYTLDD